MAPTLEPHPCEPENAGMLKEWLDTRGGLALWRSQDMCNPGRSWTTPVRNDDGTPVTHGQVHWSAGSQPDRIITDPAEVVVETVQLLEEVSVTLKQSGYM